jgi:pimeloyl-ACP methyl ester carboxylesterase
MPYAADAAETLHVDGKLATYAYRDIGRRQDSRPPLVLLHRFRGTLDHWDPAFLDSLAAHRRVLTFDSVGVGHTRGTVPNTVQGMAHAAVDFVRAMGLDSAAPGAEGVDFLGWSLGGFVAQALALDHPELVRRIVVAGSGPGGVPASSDLDAKTLHAMTAENPTDEDYLYLFFGPDEASKELGRQSLARLEARLQTSKASVTPDGWHAQLQAIMRWGCGEDSAWNRLEELNAPVLIANGVHDLLFSAGDSFAMAQRVKNGTTILYSDTGHGFLFQHPGEFASQVVHFLSAD